MSSDQGCPTVGSGAVSGRPSWPRVADGDTVSATAAVRILCAAAGLLALQPLPCRAQEPAAAPTQTNPADSAAASSDTALEEVTVTARRRGENLQTVPISVTAYSPQELETKHVQDPVSLATFSPSMVSGTVNSNADAPSFAIRGQATTQFGAPGVVTYFAEVPQSFFGLAPIDGRPGTYFDLADIQVLNGPQGTLFGKNATGGAILFVPNKPTTELGGYFQVEGGNYADGRAQGALNIPLVADTLLLRVAGEVDHRNGYVTDVGPYYPGRDYNNVNDGSVRVSLLARPSDSVENDTIVRYYHEDTHGPGYYLAAFNPQSATGQFAFLFPGLSSYPAQAAASGIDHTSLDLRQENDYDYWQAIDTTTVHVSDPLTVKNIVSYAQDREKLTYSLDATPYPLFHIINQPGGHYNAPNLFTEELQLQGNAFGDTLPYSVGGYYDRQGNSSPQFTSILSPLDFLFAGNPDQVLDTYGYFKTTSHAAFMQGTYEIGKQVAALQGLSFTAGYRYTWESVESHYFLQYVPNQGPAINTNSFNYGSYTFSADYQITPDALVYVSPRSAAKSGGSNLYQPLGSPYLDFSPERLDDVEIGLKSQFRLGGAPTRVNVAAYTGNYKNIQRQVSVVYEEVPAFVTLNTSKARVRGVELQTDVSPLSHLNLSATWAYIDSRYMGATSIPGVTLTEGAFPYAPRNKATLSGTYDVPLAGNAGKLSFNLTYAYQSSEGVAATVPFYVSSIPATELLNGRLTWSSLLGQPLDLSLFVTNITNRAFITAVNDGYYKPFGTVSYLYNEPRMYGAQLTYTF